MAGPDRPRRPRLRRADFTRITAGGRRIVTPLFLVFILAREDECGARLGITVTRKVGNAVRRNRIKRVVRAWFKEHRTELGPRDVVVIAKRDLPPRIWLREVREDLAAVVQAVESSSA